ncbi:hypothetical protein GBAR_LOCUS20509, partial [Geodia barretti]
PRCACAPWVSGPYAQPGCGAVSGVSRIQITGLRYCTRGIQSSSNTASKRVCPLLGKMRQPREGSRLGTLKPEKRPADGSTHGGETW